MSDKKVEIYGKVRVFLRISDHLDSEKLAELDGSGSGVKLSLT
jgi:hypothetical protein